MTIQKEYKIGDFLKRIKRPIELHDKSIYKRVTIRSYHKGINLRDELLGSQIGTKNQFIINTGDFLLSKIDAMTGAFGVVDETLDGAIITGNFWAYIVDKSIIDENWFLEYTSSDEFLNVCKKSCTGTTHRKYLDENIFLNHKLMLPNITEQNKISQKQKYFKDIVYKISNENNRQNMLDQFDNVLLFFFYGIKVDNVDRYNNFMSIINRRKIQRITNIFDAIENNDIGLFLGQQEPNSELNDIYWTLFFSSGDVQYINYLITIINNYYNETKNINYYLAARSAMWSMALNIKTYPLVREYFVKSNIKNTLKNYILNTDPNKMQNETREFIRQQREKGIW